MGKKIIILAMSCNKERYLIEEKVARETWAKPLVCKGNRDPDVSLYFYRGGYTSDSIRENINQIRLSCSDELNSTYEKTIKAFEMIQNKDFDYVIKTNTTTYLNLEVIKKSIDLMEEKDEIYGGRLVANPKSEFIPFFRGNFIVFPKKLVLEEISLKDKYMINGTDDNILGEKLFKYYNETKAKEYLRMLKEIDGINKIDYDEFNKLNRAWFIRFKENKTGENHVKICKKIHQIINEYDGEYIASMPHEVSVFETSKGTIKFKI